MLTRSLALELAPLGVRVNTISPGGITTPGTKPLTTSAVLEAFKARIPMRRMGDPDDIARAALFLVSPASSYMTGSNVVVDGGVLLA
jgi:NAD(P)-dependent dehydrogenase (short-subunit alcohol dehydrogenase family)